jgi:Acetyl co-enzyme A carboxylase carboxyltransferase alpha subunit
LIDGSVKHFPAEPSRYAYYFVVRSFLVLDLGCQLRNHWEKASSGRSYTNEGVQLAQLIVLARTGQGTLTTFQNLTRWQRVQLSRHAERPYTLAKERKRSVGRVVEIVERNKAPMLLLLGKMPTQNGSLITFFLLESMPYVASSIGEAATHALTSVSARIS